MVPAVAGTPQEYSARISLLAGEAKFDEALKVAEEFRKSVAGINDGKSQLHAQAMSWIAYLLSANGEVLKAGDFFESAVELYKEVLSPDHPDYATSLNNLGYHRYRMGMYQDALSLYRQALDIRERVLGPNDPVVADTLNNIAELYKSLERIDEVPPLLNRVLEIRSRNYSPDDPRLAAAMQNLAGAYELDPRGDKFLAAQNLLEKALAIRLKSQRQDHPEVAGVVSKLASNLFNQNKYEEAEKKFLEALELRRKTQPPKHPEIAGTLAGLAQTHYELGNYESAEKELREVVAIRREVLSPNSVTLSEGYRWLARTLEKEGKFDEALQMMRQGSKIVETLRKQRLLSREHFYNHLELLAAASAAPGMDQRKLLEEAFIVGQRADFGETGSAVSKMAARFATKDKKLQDLVYERDEVEARLGLLERQLTDDLSKPPSKRRTDTRSKMAELDRRRDTIERRLEKEFPAYFDLVKPDPLTIAEVQAQLKPDEALISTVTGIRQTFVWVVTAEGASWHAAPVSSVWLEASVGTLRKSLDTEDLKRNIGLQGSLFDIGLSYEIYAHLLQPLEPAFKTKKHLMIVPSGPLTSLPLQVLTVERPQILRPALGDLATYRDAAWLIRRHALSTLPSVKSLQALRKIDKRDYAQKPMIGFGNPKLTKRVPFVSAAASATRVATAQTRGTDADASEIFNTLGIFNSLEELPETEHELRTVASELGASPSDLRLGADATETSVRTADLASYKVVYFATHGLLADDLKTIGEPALVLTPPDKPSPSDDGLLTASEISDSLKLNADWVVLAACNTASGDRPGAESLSGLAKAFFHAGARALLVSHWRVDSNAATTLTTELFALQAKNKSLGRAEALQRAMLKQIEKAPSTAADLWNAYPAFWAPFTVVGEGAAETR